MRQVKFLGSEVRKRVDDRVELMQGEDRSGHEIGSLMKKVPREVIKSIISLGFYLLLALLFISYHRLAGS